MTKIETCSRCGGLGRVPNHPHIEAHICQHCRGSGKLIITEEGLKCQHKFSIPVPGAIGMCDYCGIDEATAKKPVIVKDKCETCPFINSERCQCCPFNEEVI